jgi:hypothetical protein
MENENLQQPMTNQDSCGVTPSQLVLDYLRDRRAWELRSYSVYRRAVDAGTIDNALDVIAETYQGLVGTYLLSRSENRAAPVFGDPPSVNPAATRVVGERAGPNATVVVTTIEEGTASQPLGFEYVVKQADGQWRLVDRRAKDSSGRNIRGLL